MKIKNVLKPQPKPAEKKEIPVTDVTLKIRMSADDSKALKAYREHLGFSTYKETKDQALTNRHTIDELLITELVGMASMTYLVLPVEFHEQLQKEADKLRLSLENYIRGIIYTLGKHAMDERNAKAEAQRIAIKDRRIIAASFGINKQMREALYGVYGELSDNQLKDKLVRALPQLLTDKAVLKKLAE